MFRCIPFLHIVFLSKQWFIQWSQKPYFGGEVMGAERVIGQMGHFLQSLVGGIAISLGRFVQFQPLLLHCFTSQLCTLCMCFRILSQQSTVVHNGSVIRILL